MKIKEKVEQGVAIITLSGNMMGGPETQAVHEKVKSLLTDNIRKIVIDLSGVKWMNSSGLGILMASLTSIEQSSGHLKLACVADKVQSLLMITQLIKIFETYETVDRAVATFKE